MITITGVKSAYNGTIQFEDISEASYRKLVQFVAELNGEAMPEIAREIAPSRPSEKRVEEQGVPEVPKRAEKKNTKKGIKKSEAEIELVKKLKKIVDKAKENPDEYEFRFCMARDFIAENADEFGDCSDIVLGRAAEELNLEKKVVSNTEYGSPRRMRAYPMKKRADENDSETVSAKKRTESIVPDTVGGLLKKARKDAGLSIYEMSNLLEYPYYVLQGWESGSSDPSQEAIKVLTAKVSPEFKRYLTA